MGGRWGGDIEREESGLKKRFTCADLDRWMDQARRSHMEGERDDKTDAKIERWSNAQVLS